MTWLFFNESQPKAAIFDSSGNQVLQTAGLLSIQINPTKQFSSHKLENGKVVTDNVIENQNRINIAVILNSDDYLDVYKELKAFYDANEKFSIQSRIDIYDNMYLESIPHEEDSSFANTIAINLSFIEQQFVETETITLKESDVSSGSDVTETKSGQKSATEETGTIAQQIYTFFQGLL